jgi:hypothetical protein
MPEADGTVQDTELSAQRPNLTPESFTGGELKPISTSAPTPQSSSLVPINPILSDIPQALLDTSTLPTTNPLAADDSDLIEKEWVTKAKAIVEKTKHDPYLETKEMSLFKADYLKKRYNKELKVAEQ